MPPRQIHIHTRTPTTALLACVLLSVSCNIAQVVALEEGATPASPPPQQAAEPAPEDPVERVAHHLRHERMGLSAQELERLAATIVGEAGARGFDPWLVLAVIEVESRYDAFAVSRAGAVGLMQILPGTGRALAARLGVDWQGERTLFDPAENVKLGVAYLEELVQRFGGLETALAAYNWGPGAIGRRMRRGAPVPVGYAQRVLTALADRSATARAS